MTEGVCAMFVREEAIENWLRSEVVASRDELPGTPRVRAVAPIWPRCTRSSGILIKDKDDEVRGAVRPADAGELGTKTLLVKETHPSVPDAWIDHTKTKVGVEIPFTRQFYVYEPPRPVEKIAAGIRELETQIQEWMRGLGL